MSQNLITRHEEEKLFETYRKLYALRDFIKESFHGSVISAILDRNFAFEMFRLFWEDLFPDIYLPKEFLTFSKQVITVDQISLSEEIIFRDNDKTMREHLVKHFDTSMKFLLHDIEKI